MANKATRLTEAARSGSFAADPRPLTSQRRGVLKTGRWGGGARMPRRFSRRIVSAIDESKILGVRAGARSAHRFVGIWAVVVDGRVFARSWTHKPGGWYSTFLEDPLGTLQVGERHIRIRAVPVRGNRVRDAVEHAYAKKYSTPGSAKYVRGFRAPRRRETTMEFLPASAGRPR